VFEGFNAANMNGECWKDADGQLRKAKPYLALWNADYKERQILTGFIKVRPTFYWRELRVNKLKSSEKVGVKNGIY
jgi:hypothetical protein